MKSGPISSGTPENNALRATDLEFIEDSNDLRSDMPSPPEVEVFVWVVGKAGASGSVGDDLYIIS